MSGRHRKTRKTPWILLALTVSTGGLGAVLASGSPQPPVTGTVRHSFAQPPHPLREAQEPVQAVLTAARGDSLWGIAREHCGNGTDWKSLAAANKISYPYPVSPGEKITISCGGAA